MEQEPTESGNTGTLLADNQSRDLNNKFSLVVYLVRSVPSVEGKHTASFATSLFSDIHRNIFSLPARNGGIGISDPTKIADDEYARSVEATAPLSELINEQNTHINSERADAATLDLSVAKHKVLSAKRNKNLT